MWACVCVCVRDCAGAGLCGCGIRRVCLGVQYSKHRNKFQPDPFVRPFHRIGKKKAASRQKESDEWINTKKKMPLTTDEKVAIQSFCENQKEVKKIKEEYKKKRTTLNTVKTTERAKLFDALEENDCLKVATDLYIVKKKCTSTVSFSIRLVHDTFDTIDNHDITKYVIDHKCDIKDATAEVITGTMKRLRSTSKFYADVVDKMPKKSERSKTVSDPALLERAQRYKLAQDTLKKLSKEEKNKIRPHAEQIQIFAPAVQVYMKSKDLWSQRVNVNVEHTEGMTQQFYLRRKITQKKKTLNVGDVTTMVKNVVGSLNIHTIEDFAKQKQTIMNHIIDEIQNIPVVAVEKVTFDKGQLKMKKDQ